MKNFWIILTAAVLLAPASAFAHDDDDEDLDESRVAAYGRTMYKYLNMPFDIMDRIGGRMGDDDWDDDDWDDWDDDDRKDERNYNWNVTVNGAGDHGWGHWYMDAHYPTFYIGPNLLCDKYTYDRTYGIPQREGKGLELGFYPFTDIIKCGRHIGISTALGFARNRYRFSDGNHLEWAYDTRSHTEHLDLVNNPSYCKEGVLRYWSLRIPVSLELQFNSGAFITAGAELEYRFADRLIVYPADGSKKQTISKDAGINPLNANLMFQVGFDDIGIMVRCSMLELFKNQTPFETYPLNVGFSICY